MPSDAVASFSCGPRFEGAWCLAYSVLVTAVFLFNAATSLTVLAVFAGRSVPVDLDALGVAHNLSGALAMIMLAASVWITAAASRASGS